MQARRIVGACHGSCSCLSQGPLAAPERVGFTLKFVIKIASVLFVVEVLIMLVMDRLGIDGGWPGAIADAAVLTVVASMFIHFEILVPHAREHDQAMAKLRSNEERWKLALEGSGAGVWEYDVQSAEARHSRRCKEILGFDDTELGDEMHEWNERTHAEDVARKASEMRAFLDSERAEFQAEYRMMAKDGRWRWILDRGMAVGRSAEGRPLRMIGTRTDITDQKLAQDQLRELATTDPLTAMFNRRHFLARLDEAQALSERLVDQPVSVLMLDIDHFKHVNDSHGHHAGDQVLKHFAALIGGGLRKTDTAARLGGEEFAILMPGTHPMAAGKFAERLRLRVAESAVSVGDQQVPITVSIGVSAVLATDADGLDVLKRADEAMYEAKLAGRNRVRIDVKATEHLDGALVGKRLVHLVWHSAYESGSPDIDRQHRGLFEVSNRVLNAISDELPPEAVASLLRELLGDVLEHFRDEEAELARIGYAGLGEHRRLHRALEARAQDLAARLGAGKPAIDEAFGFVAYEVVARHLLGEDRKFFALVRQHAAGAAKAAGAQEAQAPPTPFVR